jgi:hypothetical protein
MAIVDPNKNNFRNCGVGKKVLAVVGIDKGFSKDNDPQYAVHYVCVKDLSAESGDGDKGADHWDYFILNDKLRFLLGMVMKAAGHTTPFDDEDAALISEVLSNCYLLTTITSREWNGETKYQTGRNGWAPYTGAEEPDWAEVIAKGVEGHEKIREARRKKAQGGSGGGAAQRRPAQTEGDPGSDGSGSSGDDDGPMY